VRPLPLVLALLLTAACRPADPGDGGGDPTPTPDAGVPVDPYAAVDTRMAEAVAQAGSPGVTLAVYDAQDRRVFLKSYGDSSPDRRVAVASASKLVSGLVLLRLVDAGALSLDTTTGQVLGWTGPQAAVTLRQLLSFTSGLQPDPDCSRQALTTLAACAESVGAAGLLTPPGTRFEYGSGHLAVAARMAEVRTGKAWATLFTEQLKTPLGLTDPELRYFTFPRQAVGTTNPLIAGGLRASVDEYARFLALVFHRGTHGGARLVSEALVDAMGREPYPDATIGHSPVQDLGLTYRYGLTAWLECGTPAAGCDVVSSPGAFGFTPWVDRPGGYYAVLGMQLDRDTPDGVVSFAVDLEQQLRPLLREALAAP
jgi:serine-type D-Ala-D-Ala carboxypeptidase/endopeptidase